MINCFMFFLSSSHVFIRTQTNRHSEEKEVKKWLKGASRKKRSMNDLQIILF